MSTDSIYINGIQQVGVGCADAPATFAWYNRHLGFDIKVFEDVATANLMTNYTGSNAMQRHAYLAMNMRGGGGLEIWQFTNRKPTPPDFEIRIGDLGINYVKIRSNDINASFTIMSNAETAWQGSIQKDPQGRPSFFFKDPWQNLVEIIEDPYTYTSTGNPFGGVMGFAVGVSDLTKSHAFYSQVLGYDKALKTQSDYQEDFQGLLGSEDKISRQILRQTSPGKGGFSALLGPTELECICNQSAPVKQIYKDRFWGDLGYIHACFDVSGMKALRTKAEQLGYAFTVDSAESFDMGDAAGHFAYVEDPDGTLIELVETHQVPILKSIGWSINMKNRSPEKPLPNWLIKAMRIHRVKV